MKNFRLGSLLALLLSVWTYATAQRYVGGDISLLPEYEKKGAAYFDHNGMRIDSLLPYLRREGWNAVRVRLFVDPRNATYEEQRQGVVQDIDYVVALAKRIKQAGFKWMLDFHYSDTWADPGKQWTPQDWLGLSDESLADTLYRYTAHCLRTLKEAGAAPDFIQTGNEISFGMMWGARGTEANRCYVRSPEAHWQRFFRFLRAAVQACREETPGARIIIHSERSGDTPVLADFVSRLKRFGVDCDILGLSYYPYYHGYMDKLRASLDMLHQALPATPIMIVETGYPAQWSMNGEYDYSSTFPISDAGQAAFTDSLINMLHEYGQVTGLFWWFPEANEYGVDYRNSVTSSWYNATLFDNNTGRAFSALSVLSHFVSDTADGIHAVRFPQAVRAYNLLGQPLADSHVGQLRIEEERKMLVR